MTQNTNLAKLQSLAASQNGNTGVADLLALRRQQIASDLEGLKQVHADNVRYQKANEDSWVNKLGMTPGTVQADTVNALASLGSGVARLAGTATAAIPLAGSLYDSSVLNDKHYEAYQRFQQGNATEQDMELLNSTTPGMNKVFANQTVRETIDRAANRRELTRDILDAFDASSIVQSDNRDQLVSDAKEAFAQPWEQAKKGWKGIQDGSSGAKNLESWGDLAAGAGKLVAGGVKALVTNPAGTGEFIAENLPQVGVGALGAAGKAALLASNAGYAGDAYVEGIENFQKANDGAMPSDEQRQEMGAWAASTFVAEQVADAKLLKSVMGADVAEAAKDGFKKALVAASREMAKDMGLEAATEGYQTVAEGKAKLQEASAEDVYVASVIGAGAGGGISGLGSSGALASTAGEAIKSKYNKLADEAENEAPAVPKSAAFDRAVAERNPDLITEGKSSGTPDEALAVVHRLATDGKATPEERTALQSKAKSLVEAIANETAALRASTSQGRQAIANELAEIEAQLSQMPANAPERANQEQLAELLREELAQAAPDEAKQQAIDAQLKKAEQRLANAEQLYAAVLEEGSKKEEFEATFNKANAVLDGLDDVAVEQSRQAAKQVVVLSMASPQNLPAKQARELVSNRSNALTDTERDYLAAYADATEAIEALEGIKQVNKEVLYGDKAKDQMGMVQYRERIGQALSSGNVTQAIRSLQGLVKFAQGHRLKANAMAQAFEQFQQSGRPMQVVRTDAGWQVSPLTMSKDEMKALGKGNAYDIGKNSQRLVEVTVKEAEAIELTKKALQAAFSLPTSEQTQSQKPQQATSPAPQQAIEPEQVSAPQPEAQQEQAAPESPPQPQPKQKVKAKTKTKAPETLEKTLERAEKAYRRVARNNPASLYSALKNRLGDSDLNEIYGPDWKKRFTSLKGKNSKALGDLIEDGSLDAFLPANLQFGNGIASGLDAMSEARELIVDRLRERNYLTQDTINQLAQMDVEIQRLEEALANQSTESLQDELDRTIEELESIPTTDTANDAGTSDGADPVVASEAETGSVDSTVAEEVGTGKLTALADEANPVSKLIKQGEGSDDVASKRPLVAVKDFLSSWLEGKVSPAQFLKDGLTEEQKTALRSFAKNAKKWAPVIQGLLARNQDQKYSYQSPVEYLMAETDGKLDLDENVKTAMSMAMMTWLADAVSRNLVNNDEAINAILGRASDDFVNDREWAALAYIGVRRAAVADSLGQKIVSALGIKATKDASLDFIPKLEASLGAYALEALIEAGLVKTEVISGEAFKQLTGSKDTDTNASHIFIKVAQERKGQVSPEVRAIVDSLKGSKNVIEKLFGVEASYKAPSFEPVPFTQTKAKDSRKKVPSYLAKILEKKNKEQNFVAQDIFRLVASMAEDLVMEMAGGTARVEEDLHISRRKAAEAKNDGLRREISNFINFVADGVAPSEQGLNTPFYFEHNVWKNQRVGITNNLVNPQTSKVHRYMIYRPSWETEVDPSNTQQMNNFKLRVLEGLGVKTDKKANAKSLAEWKSKTENEVIAQGVAAIQASLNGQELTQEQQIAVRNAVAEGGEKFHSLSSLVALAHWKNANGGKFTVRLTGEVDGVTNGPMLSHVFLGAAATVGELFGLVNKGGFFQAGSPFNNYNIFRGSDGAMDLYESVAEMMINDVKALKNPNLDALWTFTGELGTEDNKVSKAGRDIVKKPITALMFGSSLNKVVEGMSESFLESVYKTIEKVAQGKEDKDKVLASLKVVLGRQAWPEKMTVEQMMNTDFTEQQQAQIKSFFAAQLGDTVKQVMQTKFAVFLERRDSLNKTANFAFGLYDSVYQSLRNGYIDFLKESGAIEVDGAGKPIRDLTQEQQAKLDKLTQRLEPIMSTVMSLRSKELGAAISMVNTERKLSDDPLYRATVRFNRAKNKSSKYSAQALKLSGPGVAMVPFATHSGDSGVSHEAVEKTEALNIHDAHVAGMGIFVDVARNLNEATWNTLLEYSPATEVYNSLERTIRGLVKVMQDPELSIEAGPAIKAFLKSADPKSKGSLESLLIRKLSDAKLAAYTADRIRLEALSQMQAIDQYALEGGEYRVKGSDRQKAKEKLDALSMELPADLIQEINSLGSVLSATPVRKQEQTTKIEEDTNPDVQAVLGLPNAQAMRLMKVLTGLDSTPGEFKTQMDLLLASMSGSGMSLTQVVNDNLNTAQAAALVQFLGAHKKAGINTPFGDVGTPLVAPSQELTKFFEANPETDGKTMLKEMARQLAARSDNKTAQYYRKMLAMLNKVIGDDVRVVYVTPEMNPDAVMTKPATASRGWYVPADGTVYVLSPDFVQSGLTSELLIHELTHAALVDIIANPVTKTQRELVAELNDLMEQAKTYMEDHAITDPTMMAAVSDVQEFVAWGMSNRAFQSRVLGKMQVPNRLGKLTTALQEFINKLVGLLVGQRVDESMEMVDGVTALIANVTQLFQEVSNGQEQKAKEQANKINQTFSMASPQPQQAAIDMTTQQVFDALDSVTNTPQFIERMETLLNDLVVKLHGPFGAIKTAVQQGTQQTAQDAWLASVLSGARPFASKVLNAGLAFSQKEAFVTEQLEAVLTTATAEMSTASHPVYRELEKVYTQARDVLKGKIDQDLYKFLFYPQAGMGSKSNYIARFAALALGHEDFNKALAFETRKPELSYKGKTFMERLEMTWRALMDWLGSRLTNTFMGQQANSKTLELVKQLVEIELRAKGQVSKKSMFDFLEPLEERAAELLQEGKAKVGKAAESRFVKTNRFVLVRAAGAVVSITANDRVEKVVEGIQQMRDKVNDASNGTLMGTVNYIKGVGQWLNTLMLSGKQVEKERKAIITDTANAVLAAFQDDGASLSAEQKQGISATFLRTGMHNLLDKYDMTGIQSLLDDSVALEAAIKEETALLTAYPEMHYYVNQAHGLGFYRATEQVAQANQMLNAHNISRLYGTGRSVPTHADQAKEVIERLVTLYGLRYTDPKNLNAAREVLRSENQRGLENGVKMTLLMHKHLEADAKDRLFRESPALMMHGYTPEILNPKTTFQVSSDPAEWNSLLEQGYEFVGNVSRDLADPDSAKPKMFILRGGGLGRYQSAAVSLTSMGAKGDSKHNNYYNPNDSIGVANMQSMSLIASSHQSQVAQQFGSSNNFDPVAERKRNNFLLPLMNEQGQVVDYRYVMSAKNKDTLLDRDNRFEHILGVMAGSTYDKLASREQNRKVLEALKEHYSAEFGSNPTGFVRIAHNSNDARLREIWAMLPDQTQRDAKDIWGKSGIWIPKNMVDTVFGYRKASLADAWEKTNPNAVEKLMINTVTDLLRVYGKMSKGMDSAQAAQYSKRGAVVVRRAEAAWQEIVHEVKDFIVVKTGTVLLGNVLSNLGLLAMKGVPVLDGLKYQKVALKAAMDYERDRHALAQLKALEETGYRSQSMAEVQAEIVRLEDALARNPVSELINYGLMPTIVEDITMEGNPYSYKSQLTHWADEKTARVNKHVLNVGRFVYMAHDTPLYKFLSKTTQYSDFVARYAMYMHLTTRKDNPLSKADAVYEASESFVNYDVPLPKYIQYMDDMGLMPFIKYFLSIQRVLAKTFKDNPLRVLSVLALNNLMGNLPMPTDSSFFLRIGSNPLDTGAFGLPSALGEAMTVQTGMSLIK